MGKGHSLDAEDWDVLEDEGSGLLGVY